VKILILGTGKSGTTVLVYKVAGGLPDCRAFSGGKPGKYLGDHESAVYKHTYNESKGKSFDVYGKHLEEVSYDRKIWMARDPRDVAVSRMLYRWQRGNRGQTKQYRAHLERVLQKEKDPHAISFCEICRYTGFNGWPITTEDVVEEERIRYQRMGDFVKGLDDDWFLFTYEAMVGRDFKALNEYLEFKVQEDAQVPVSTGKTKVVRKKSTGDWRHWFTQEDVARLRPAYLPYMERIGYDCDDWALSPNPLIEPDYSSKYMQGLIRKKTLNHLRGFKDRLLLRLGMR